MVRSWRCGWDSSSSSAEGGRGYEDAAAEEGDVEDGGRIETGCEKCERTICPDSRRQHSPSGARQGQRAHLNMQRTRHRKANDQVQPPMSRRVDASEDDASKPQPEDDESGEFEDAELEERRAARGPVGEDKGVRKGKEVEARKAHDEVVELVSARATRSAVARTRSTHTRAR